MTSLLVALLTSSGAYATPLTSTFCARMPNEFVDRDVGDQWTSAMANVPLRGVLITIVQYDSGGQPAGYIATADPVDDDGCLSFTSYVGWSYTAELTSHAIVNGVDIDVYDGESGYVDYEFQRDFGGANQRYYPTTSETKYVTAPFGPAWRALAVGAHAMYLSTAGLKTADCETAVCDSLEYGIVSNGFNGSNQDRILVGGHYKFLYGHETGHGVGRRRDEGEEPVSNWDAAGDEDCDASPGDNGSQDGTLAREYQSVALREGFADFYAAWMWNSRASACRFSTNESDDFDIDLDDQVEFHFVEEPLAIVDFDCDGIPLTEGAGFVDHDDWLEDLLDHTDAGSEQCSLGLTGVGTPFDVLRYLWDTYTDGTKKVSFGRLVDLYDASDPHDWAATVATGPNVSDNPYIRWRDAAYEHPDSTVYEQHVITMSNGLDHGPGQ